MTTPHSWGIGSFAWFTDFRYGLGSMRSATIEKLCLCGLVALLLPGGIVAGADRVSSRLNILFLMDDQHRGDWLGAAGAKWLATPNLDRLAREGALFRRAYSSTPICLPARAALLTGMGPWGHGCLGYVTIPQRYNVEKPRIFTEAGWRTHVVGKNHYDPVDNLHGYQTGALGDSDFKGTNYWDWFQHKQPGRKPNYGARSSNDQRGGMTYPFDESMHRTSWTTGQAVEFLNSYCGKQPWFLKVSYLHPHPPFNPLSRWEHYYKGINLPTNIVGRWAMKAYGHINGSLQENVDTPRGIIPKEELLAMRRSYAASISQVDENIGRVLDAVEKRGELEKTLILFTSDHGDMMGDQLLYRKSYPYEGSTRVPMIVRWPASLGLAAARGQLRDELVELRDVLPTFLDAAGLPKPSSIEGMSLLSLLRGEKGRQFLDLELASTYAPDLGWVALMDARHKYIYFLHTGQQQLFDLVKDPGELDDLVGLPEYADILNQWRRKMIEQLRPRGESWVRDDDLVVHRQPLKRRPNNPNLF